MAEPLATGYGKEAVSVYRTDGVRSLFAAEVGMTARGAAFLPSYTAGDNTAVVATDSMKNFVHATALEYDGTSLEDFLDLLARRFLDTYPQVERIELRGRELPFTRRSEQSFERVEGDRGVAELALDRSGALEHRCGREGIRLVKLTGSSFAGFVRDEYTTLAESHDRPLYVHLDVHWRNQDFGKRAPGEEVRDSVAATFAEFESASIQELVHRMGTRLLDGFQELAEVSFAGENRLWDTAQVLGSDERVRVYTDPRPPFGRIELTLGR
ncbi:MAG TPA: urate oxidase [Gaiellaceae bacterium]|nr:urate oxidase [Gaiellaceae bacterium]